MNRPQPRHDIGALPRYVPGARGNTTGPTPIKLSSNETVFGPLTGVAEVIAAAAEQIHRYPDMFAVDLTARIASHHGLDADQVVVGGGSVAVLQHVLQAYCDAGAQVIYAWRSFEAYPIITAVSGAQPVPVPLTDDWRHDLDAMAAAITDRTAVIMVCSPNNPTGAAVTTEELTRFMERVPSTVVVVLDEAYAEFVDDPAMVDGRSHLAAYPNLISVRTFSKAYGLAAMRVGYAMGHPDVIAPVRACVTPFSVSGLAQVAALASLEHDDQMRARVAEVALQRIALCTALADAGHEFPPPHGNFVWLALGEQSMPCAQYLAEQPTPILVRPFAHEGIRVTVGSAEDNTAFLGAFTSFT